MESKAQAFTLIELAVVTAIIGILSMVLLPSLIDVVEAKRAEAERLNFSYFEDDIRRSFQDTDWGRNLGAFPAGMPQELVANYQTSFGLCTEGTLATDGAWYVKLARIRGASPVIGAPISNEAQRAVFDVAFNAYGQPRILVPGPVEAKQQRYLLLSVAAPPAKGLEVPSNDGSADWFDAIWTHDWENEGAPLPALWEARLTEAQKRRWLEGRGSTTNCHRLIVRRMVQPRFSITLNNAHPRLWGWLDLAGVSRVKEIAPSSDPVVLDGVLAGSLAVFRRGLVEPGSEIFRLHVNDNITFSVMSGSP